MYQQNKCEGARLYPVISIIYFFILLYYIMYVCIYLYLFI